MAATTVVHPRDARDGDGLVVVDQRLRARADETIEWRPRETIVHAGGRARLATSFELDAPARFIASEITALVRPRSGERFESHEIEQHTRIAIAGMALLDERLRVHAEERSPATSFGPGGYPVRGALYAYPANDALLATVRGQLPRPCPVATHSATLLGPLLIVRCLARRIELVRGILETVSAALRPQLLGHALRAWQS